MVSFGDALSQVMLMISRKVSLSLYPNVGYLTLSPIPKSSRIFAKAAAKLIPECDWEEFISQSFN